jgi:hypothetical protein
LSEPLSQACFNYPGVNCNGHGTAHRGDKRIKREINWSTNSSEEQPFHLSPLGNCEVSVQRRPITYSRGEEKGLRGITLGGSEALETGLDRV